nr:hypothetical protein [Bifidobacterium dentium]
MSSHVELNPDDDMLGLCLGLKAMRLASTQKTHKTGTIRIPTSTGKDFIAGKGAEDGANWIDSEGVQTPLVDTDAIDKAVDEISAKADAASASADKAYEEAKRTGQLAVTASRTEYATSTDATVTPSDGWSETPPTYMDGQYTWLRVTVTYGDGHTELSNPVLMTGPKGGKGETGDTGTTGAAGVSVTSLTTFWRLAADTPDTPSGADDPSGWSRTEPSIPDGYEGKLYRTIRTIMSDGTATWTSPDVDSMFEYMARTYRTASGAVTVSSEAKRTAEGNAETIKQVGATANDALSKATTVETNFAGFKTEVSETYQTKAGMSSYGTKSYIDETSKSVALGVVQDYKGADGSGLATKTDISVSRTEITSEVSNTYATKDGVSKEISSKITQNNSSLEVKFSNAGSIEYVTNGSFRENLDGWTVHDGQWVINGGDNALQYYKAVSAGASTLGPWQDPSVLMGASTRQRLIRRSFDIANYSNASGATLRMSCRLNDGTWSGEYPSVELDSTFDWMHVDMVETIPDGKSIDRILPIIRTVKACTVNVEIRNFSLRDITDSYKSADAVINMTGQGVRVGKNKNGAWTGMSALVGTDATFDVLDTSGKRLLEVSATGVKFPHSEDGTRLALGYVAGSGSASDTLYIGDIITGQQEGGPRNRLGFTGDEVSLEGGDININASDNQLSLYGRKGANLLVPDGGNVQVGGQSGTSNTTLTLRGSTVNMSGGLVNVNGRTLNAPVDAKQSQRWDNIQLDVKCVNRVVTVNILHPLGSNAIIGDQSDQCEIGYIKEGYRPSRMIGCHLAAYNTTNLFLEINPATGKVACFRMWGNQNTWAYFSASLSYVI